MSIIKPKNIEDRILSELQKGSVVILSLIKKIQDERPGTTKQAVYAALRNLRREEMVLCLKGVASLNLTWINQMTSYLELARKSYQQSLGQGSFLDLEDRERIKYYFNDAHKADIFWTHAYYVLLGQLQPNEPVFLYNPHEWFFIARKENETTVLASTVAANHPYLVVAGGDTFLDKYIRKYFDGEKSQYHLLPASLFKDSTYYINIFGDFLIEVWLDKKVVGKLEKIYQTTAEWNDGVEKKFQKILALNGRLRIVISRNHKKAIRLKKTLSKGFAIKKS